MCVCHIFFCSVFHQNYQGFALIPQCSGSSWISCHCINFREDNFPVLRRQFASGYFFEKTIVHCFIFREDNYPVLRRQFYSAQFMVKITVFREDNQPVLRLQRRQSASASHFEKTILPVLKKTILLEKTILPFPLIPHMSNISKN